MTPPEAAARTQIDRQLDAAGWAVQDLDALNLSAASGVAVRELRSKGGPADYILFVDGKALGVLEAKAEGATLSGVAEQSARYSHAKKWIPARWADPLPFTYESTGLETRFIDQRDPDARSRPVFTFHRPERLLALVKEPDALRARLRDMPEIATEGYRACQIDAVRGLEASLAANRPRALIQMATGAGKTYFSVHQVCRLLKHARARRVLFLVDRANLGRQALREFQNFPTPGDGRRFTELYNVQLLGPGGLDPVSKVVISTVQRLWSQLSGTPLDDEADEHSGYDLAGTAFLGERGAPREVQYSSALPIETFDFIIVDECHRSIYNLWSQVLEYFDAFLVGLTATPARHTLGYFDQNLVTEHPHQQAVADGVNVGYDIYRIKTECVLFLRDVKSQVYFEQMKGRGTRTISPTELAAVTPDAGAKTRFVLVDAVGVTESDKTDSRPLERKPTASFDQLLTSVALGARDEDTLTSLANRLARLDRTLTDADRAEIEQLSGGVSVRQLAADLLNANDPDTVAALCKRHAHLPEEEALEKARQELANTAAQPLATNPELRTLLETKRRQNEITIDHITKDTLIDAGYDVEKARSLIRSWKQFIEDNKDELTALQILYNLPRAQRGSRLTHAAIKSLADAVAQPPYQLAPAEVWKAYEHLERRPATQDPAKTLTNLIVLVRHALDPQGEQLVPFPDLVEARFQTWLSQQSADFTDAQRQWLEVIKNYIALNGAFETEDQAGYLEAWERVDSPEAIPLAVAKKAFGGADPKEIIEELNEALVA